MPRAIIFDVYQTLLALGPGPVDAEMQWWELVNRLDGLERMSLEEFGTRCRAAVERSHAISKGAGIEWPEVVWLSVVCDALPGLRKLGDGELRKFARAHMRLLRSTGLSRGAGPFLRRAIDQGVVLGIASNAQAYTLDELSDALAEAELGVEIFDSSLCAWSFENGFSKPNPHVFAPIAARLAHRGIEAGEICMIGDRMDNDIEPARMFGWRTWRFSDGEPGDDCGDWEAAIDRLLR